MEILVIDGTMEERVSYERNTSVFLRLVLLFVSWHMKEIILCRKINTQVLFSQQNRIVVIKLPSDNSDKIAYADTLIFVKTVQTPYNQQNNHGDPRRG